jgi:putative spermidine/putrescine transport system ATP-binding protein
LSGGADAAHDGLGGTVRSRTFQGNHWLYRVDCAIGPVTVLAPNDGGTAFAEGQVVRVHWAAQDLRLRAQP